MKIDINAVHYIALIALTALAIVLVLNHQMTLAGGIIQVIIGTIGITLVPAALRVKTPIEQSVDSVKEVIKAEKAIEEIKKDDK